MVGVVIAILVKQVDFRYFSLRKYRIALSTQCWRANILFLSLTNPRCYCVNIKSRCYWTKKSYFSDLFQWNARGEFHICKYTRKLCARANIATGKRSNAQPKRGWAMILIKYVRSYIFLCYFRAKWVYFRKTESRLNNYLHRERK